MKLLRTSYSLSVPSSSRYPRSEGTRSKRRLSQIVSDSYPAFPRFCSRLCSGRSFRSDGPDGCEIQLWKTRRVLSIALNHSQRLRLVIHSTFPHLAESLTVRESLIAELRIGIPEADADRSDYSHGPPPLPSCQHAQPLAQRARLRRDNRKFPQRPMRSEASNRRVGIRVTWMLELVRVLFGNPVDK